MAAAPKAEESPGSTETRRRIRSGGGDPRESATESKPPQPAAVRVKGCGKSAPLGRRRPRHGKPRREQDRIGAYSEAAMLPRPVSGSSPGLVARGGRQPPSQRNGHRARETAPYRTRLTGRLAFRGSRQIGSGQSIPAHCRLPLALPRQPSLNPEDALMDHRRRAAFPLAAPRSTPVVFHDIRSCTQR